VEELARVSKFKPAAAPKVRDRVRVRVRVS
jgi:hypothetical protein